MIIQTTSPSSTGGHTQPNTLFTVSEPRSEIRPASAEEHGRRSCPTLRLVAEPYRQHCQQRPAESKGQQDHAGQYVLFGLDERSGDKGQGNDKSERPTMQRQSTRCVLRAWPEASGLLLVAVLVCRGHDGLNSMKMRC